MDSLEYIYDLVKAVYTRTYMSFIAQSEQLDRSDVPVVLVQSVNVEPTKNKDLAILDIESIAITVFCGNYDVALAASKAIRTLLEAVADNQYIREVEFDSRTTLYDENILTHQVVNNFYVHTK